MCRTYRRALCILLLVTTHACSEEDTTAPPAPRLDPVRSPTSLPEQVLTGSAEYGATVRIAGGLAAVDTTADPFTAEWRATVQLHTSVPAGASAAPTELSITAVDAAGNVSEATAATLLYEPPHPELLRLELSSDVISADGGEILATATAINDELLDLAGFAVTFTLSGVPGINAPNDRIVATTNSSGVARATFSNLRAAGARATITATSFSETDSRSFDIVAGRATVFSDLALEGAAADGSIAAGEDVAYRYALEDAYGNTALGQVLVSVSDPSAVVFDDGISGEGLVLGLTRVGAYVLTARIAGSGTRQTLDIGVTTASGPRYLDLTLTLSRMGVGNSVLALTVVRDAYGNVVAAPAPSISIAPQNPSTTDYYTQRGNELTITKAGVYVITGTFDDGVNGVATDFEYILVEEIPDLEPPLVRIDTINGYPICPATGRMVPSGTDLTNCDTLLDPPVFRRGAVIVVTVRSRDNRSLTAVGFKAFGAGSSFSDGVLVGAGQYQAGTDLDIAFNFTVQTGWNGDVSIVAAAADAHGNSANSASATVRVGIDVDANGRVVEALASGAQLNAVRDVALDPSNRAFATNRDRANPFVFELGGIYGQAVSSFADFGFLGEAPEFVAFDAGGNLYASIDGSDELWQVAPDGSYVEYVDGNLNGLGGWDPEGLATLGAIAATGRWTVSATLANDDCLAIQIGGAAFYVLQVRTTATACSNSCNFGGGPVVPSACVQSIGATIDTQTAALVGFLNQQRLTTGMSAFSGAGCTTVTGGAGTRCVFLVADNAGAQPPPSNLSVMLLGSTNNGAWSPVAPVHNGADAELLFVADRGNDAIHELQIPSAPGAAPLASYDFTGTIGGGMRDMAAVSRRATADAAGLAPRLLLYAADDGDRVLAFDSGRARFWRLVNGGRLNAPFGIAYVPSDDADNDNVRGGDCLLVTSQGATDEILAYTNVDANSATLEGGQPLATGFSRGGLRGLGLDASDPDPRNWSLLAADVLARTVVRLYRSADPNDCF